MIPNLRDPLSSVSSSDGRRDGSTNDGVIDVPEERAWPLGIALFRVFHPGVSDPLSRYVPRMLGVRTDKRREGQGEVDLV